MNRHFAGEENDRCRGTWKCVPHLLAGEVQVEITVGSSTRALGGLKGRVGGGEDVELADSHTPLVGRDGEPLETVWVLLIKVNTPLPHDPGTID